MREEIRKLALKNALLYNGKANPNSVMASFMATKPKGEPKEILKAIREVTEEVNSLSLDMQKKEAQRLEVRAEREEKEERHGLQKLEGATKGGVITRAAPNPDGPLHLGNARAFVLSALYAKEYDGRFILRFDDTDPRTKRPVPEAYKWIPEDLEWLGIKPDIVIYSSDRMDVYYEKAYELVKMEKAYVCTCDDEKRRKLISEMTACECRNTSLEESERKWFRFLDEYKEGEAVLRIKTDLEHKDPAVRDWPAMRIIENANHPRVGNEYKIWPLYNFASSIDDHELGVTHILRAQEHFVNTIKQKFLYDHFNWSYPMSIHHGRLSIKGVVLSKSKTTDGMNKGFYKGFDDPRLGTLKSFRRRGFQPEAIVNMLRDIGANPNDISIDIRNLSAYNKKIVDARANRHFFISDPVKMELHGAERHTVLLPLHPEDSSRGNREISVGKDVIIERADFAKLEGKVARLKEFCNVKIGKHAEYAGNEIKKDMMKIHWLSESDCMPVTVVTSEAKEIKGLGESSLKDAKVNDIIQFERFGFVRVDCKNPFVVYYAHN